MSEWKEYKLGEVADVTKLAGFEYTKYFKYDDKGETIALRALNVRDGNLDLSDVKRIDKNISDNLIRSKLFKDDILFTYVGANIGQFALVPENDKFHLAPNICRIRCKKDCFPYFLYCYFRTRYFKESLEGYTHGSSQPTMPMSTIRQIPVSLPPLIEQQKISEVLSSLDDKIELLHKQNETLEKIAETLFRQWFIVDEKEDWEIGKVGDEFNFVMGQSPPGDSYNEIGEGILFFQGRTDFTFRFPTSRMYTTDPKRYANKFDTLISVRAPVGDINMAYENCCIGRGLSAFRHINPDNHSYTYYKLRSMIYKIKEFEDTGTVFGSITKDDFVNMEVAIPNNDLIFKFETAIKPLDQKIYLNSNQIKNLTNLRDMLLPKLMSGEVRVKEKSND